MPEITYLGLDTKYDYSIEQTNGRLMVVSGCDIDSIVSNGPWYPLNDGVRRYSTTKIEGVPFSAHRVIMGNAPEDGLEVDHVNGDGLDNRRCNLRWVTHQQNIWNKAPISGMKGVHKSPCGKRWIAQIHTESGGKKYLGRFTKQRHAALAYDKAAAAAFGEYAWLNFPKSESDAFEPSQFATVRIKGPLGRGVRIKKLSDGALRFTARFTKQGGEIFLGSYNCPALAKASRILGVRLT